MEAPFVSRRVSMDTFHRNFYQSDLGKLYTNKNENEWKEEKCTVNLFL